MKIWISPTADHYVGMPQRKPVFLIAPDSFKGSFDAATVAGAIAAGVEAEGGTADRCPVADGGEGTMAVLLEALGGERRDACVHDPLRRSIAASFALLPGASVALCAHMDAKGDTVGIVEAAQASGLPLLAPEERDPERADTFGAGELIAAAIAAGAKRVLVAAGGSASPAPTPSSPARAASTPRASTARSSAPSPIAAPVPPSRST
jgi:glycerate kinase